MRIERRRLVDAREQVGPRLLVLREVVRAQLEQRDRQRTSSRTRLDGVAEHADAADLDLDAVARRAAASWRQACRCR